jgi:hypothetical protein
MRIMEKQIIIKNKVTPINRILNRILKTNNLKTKIKTPLQDQVVQLMISQLINPWFNYHKMIKVRIKTNQIKHQYKKIINKNLMTTLLKDQIVKN